MKRGIITYSADPETVWNGFRLGVFALKQGDQVKAFLLAKGVECEQLDTDQFKLKPQSRCRHSWITAAKSSHAGHASSSGIQKDRNCARSQR